MKTALILALPALLIAAPAAAQSRDTYRAVGTEPFWSLDIGRSTMTFKPAQGRATSVAKPRAITSANGQTYRARGMTVAITHRRCSDGMSDRSYRDTVKVTIGRRTYSGCGGEASDAAGNNQLAGTRWTIAAVNGRAVRLDRPATVNFTGDRVQGRICNSFGGSYRLDRRNQLTADSIVATQMACPGEPMRVESSFLQLARSPMQMRLERDTLTLSSRSGSVTLRRAR